MVEEGGSEDCNAGRVLRSRRIMGKPPAGPHIGFRFLPNEVAEMEKIMAVMSVPSRDVHDALAEKFNKAPERSRAPVRAKQIWNWFQNRRYKQSRAEKAADAASPSSSGRFAATLNTALPGQRTNDLQFEAISSRDGAWYDIRSFLAHRFSEEGEPEISVSYAGFQADEDEWIALKSVRRRSLPCEGFECLAVFPGDRVLCFQEGNTHALYYDAKIIDVQRKRHDSRGCRCRFWIRYDHDQFEEVVPLRKVCRRPETDYRLKRHPCASNSSNSSSNSNNSSSSSSNSSSNNNTSDSHKQEQQQQQKLPHVHEQQQQQHLQLQVQPPQQEQQQHQKLPHVHEQQLQLQVQTAVQPPQQEQQQQQKLQQKLPHVHEQQQQQQLQLQVQPPQKAQQEQQQQQKLPLVHEQQLQVQPPQQEQHQQQKLPHVHEQQLQLQVQPPQQEQHQQQKLPHVHEQQLQLQVQPPQQAQQHLQQLQAQQHLQQQQQESKITGCKRKMCTVSEEERDATSSSVELELTLGSSRSTKQQQQQLHSEIFQQETKA